MHRRSERLGRRRIRLVNEKHLPFRKRLRHQSVEFVVESPKDLRVNELQLELQQARQDQRTKRETVTQIQAFLGRFGFASEEKIEAELVELNDEARGLEQELERLREG